MKTTKKYKELDFEPKIVKFGFFSDVQYPSGVSVPQVAFWLEYGTKNIQERAFFKKAVDNIKGELSEIILGAYNKGTGVVNYDQVGLEFKQKVQASITEQGLIDTGSLRKAVAYKVEEV